MSFFLLLNTKEDMLKKVGNYAVDGDFRSKGKNHGSKWLWWL